MDNNVYSGGAESPDFAAGGIQDSVTHETPDSGDVLQHLLEIETQAAALVDDAQIEADKRIKASEERNRERYEEEYRRRVEQLEAEYREKIGIAKVEYQAKLDVYRKNLDAMTLYFNDFSCLAEKLLFGDR
jgi:vacuolar-type H+-ATPase subunit H